MMMKKAHPNILTSTLPSSLKSSFLWLREWRGSSRVSLSLNALRGRRKDAPVVITVRLDVFRLSSASCRLVVPIGSRFRASWERHGWRRSFETG